MFWGAEESTGWTVDVVVERPVFERGIVVWVVRREGVVVLVRGTIVVEGVMACD
jgi:hypothetical protein